MKARTESGGELRNGSAEEWGVAREWGAPEGALLLFVSSVRVFGWTGGSWSMHSVQRAKVLRLSSLVILLNSNAQSRLRAKTSISSDMQVRTGK